MVFSIWKRTTKLDKQSFSHLWIRSLTTQMKRNLRMITLFLGKYNTKLIGNTIKMQYIGQNYSEHRIKDCNSGKRSDFQSSPMRHCAE